MNVLIACEFSGVVRDAFRERGHEAWSADLPGMEPEGRWPNYHLEGDARWWLDGSRGPVKRWDLLIAHPPCTRLTNSGVRWLSKPPAGRSVEDMQRELREGADLYLAFRNAPIPRRCIENPIMHRYAREMIQPGPRQVVQPWWFGDPAYKATGLELIGLPNLKPTHVLTEPERGSEEWKRWCAVHRAPPGPDRWKLRSRTYPGIAAAMAEQWETGNG